MSSMLSKIILYDPFPSNPGRPGIQIVVMNCQKKIAICFPQIRVGGSIATQRISKNSYNLVQDGFPYSGTPTHGLQCFFSLYLCFLCKCMWFICLCFLYIYSVCIHWNMQLSIFPCIGFRHLCFLVSVTGKIQKVLKQMPIILNPVWIYWTSLFHKD